jgi:hypothetical protein
MKNSMLFFLVFVVIFITCLILLMIQSLLNMGNENYYFYFLQPSKEFLPIYLKILLGCSILDFVLIFIILVLSIFKNNFKSKKK